MNINYTEHTFVCRKTSISDTDSNLFPQGKLEIENWNESVCTAKVKGRTRCQNPKSKSKGICDKICNIGLAASVFILLGAFSLILSSGLERKVKNKQSIQYTNNPDVS